MIKALVKKQMQELFKSYFVNRKTGKARSKGSVIGFFILFALLMGFLGVMFYGMSTLLADAFIAMKLDWLYFAFMGLIATLLGTFGSVFNTYAGIYHATDNELLLSMPIKPSAILFARISGVYLLGLLYEALAFVPAMICYWIKATPTVLNVLFPIFLLFVLSFFIAALTCLLGWLVALISSKLKNKNIITVLLSLVFLGLYYFVCMRFNNLLSALVANAQVIGSKIQAAVYPAYAFGLAATGKPLYMLIFTLFVAVCFGLTYYVMSRSFVKITTTKSGDKKKEYKEKPVKIRNIKSALFYKELKRFTSSPTYMMNCGLGLVFIPALAVVAIIKADDINFFFTNMMPAIAPLKPIIAVAIICSMFSLNNISAPSISLEGKSLWQLQSLPVDAYEVLEAKVSLCARLNIIPAIIATEILGLVIKAEYVTIVLMFALVIVFAWFMATLGVVLNLKMPNLTWTNETVPVKQGMPVMIQLFGGWFLSFGLFGLGFLLRNTVGVSITLGLFAAVLTLATLLLNNWLKKKGTAIFRSL